MEAPPSYDESQLCSPAPFVATFDWMRRELERIQALAELSPGAKIESTAIIDYLLMTGSVGGWIALTNYLKSYWIILELCGESHSGYKTQFKVHPPPYGDGIVEMVEFMRISLDGIKALRSPIKKEDREGLAELKAYAGIRLDQIVINYLMFHRDFLKLQKYFEDYRAIHVRVLHGFGYNLFAGAHQLALEEKFMLLVCEAAFSLANADEAANGDSASFVEAKKWHDAWTVQRDNNTWYDRYLDLRTDI